MSVYDSRNTPWTAYTPSSSWNTNVTLSGQWRRVGGELEVRARVLCTGLPNSANLSFGIPTGLTIDTTKMTDTGVNGNEPIGVAMATDSGVQYYPGDVIYLTTTTVAVQPYKTDVTYATNATSYSAGVPITYGNNDTVTVMFKVPIVGW